MTEDEQQDMDALKFETSLLRSNLNLIAKWALQEHPEMRSDLISELRKVREDDRVLNDFPSLNLERKKLIVYRTVDRILERLGFVPSEE